MKESLRQGSIYFLGSAKGTFKVTLRRRPSDRMQCQEGAVPPILRFIELGIGEGRPHGMPALNMDAGMAL